MILVGAQAKTLQTGEAPPASQTVRTRAFRVEVDSGRSCQLRTDEVSALEVTATRPDGTTERLVASAGGVAESNLQAATAVVSRASSHDLKLPEIAASASPSDELAQAGELLALLRHRLPTEARIVIEANWCAVALADEKRTDECLRRTARITLRLEVAAQGVGCDARAGIYRVGTLADITAADVDRAVEELDRRATELADAIPMPGYRGPLELSPRAAGIFAHEVVAHLVEADNYLALVDRGGRLGCRVADQAVSAFERAAVPGQWASYALDDEGTGVSETEVVSEGRISALLTDVRNARRLGCAPSGHGRRAWPLDPVVPRFSRIELCATGQPQQVGLREGIRIDGFARAWLEPRTGIVTLCIDDAHVLSGGQRGQILAGGEIKAPALTLLAQVAEVGSDTEWHPSLCLKRGKFLPVDNGAPSVLLDDVTIAP